MKKILSFLTIIVALFIAISLVTKMQQAEKTAGNPYGKDKLHPETVELLDNPDYDNIVTPKEVKEKINSGEDVTVYFFSPLCGYCMETTPIIKPVAQDLNIDLLQYNVLEFEEGWNDHNLESTPTVIHYKNGEEVARASGYHEADKFNWWFNEYVK